MRDQEKSKEELLRELVVLRNKVNALQFDSAKKDYETAKKEKEEAHLKNIRDYAAWVVYAAPAVLCQLDPDGTIRFVNPFSEKITGYKTDDLIGKNLWKTLFPGDEFQQIIKLYKFFEKGDVRDYDMTLVTKSGQKCTIAFHSINRFDETGKIKEIVLVGMDVSARKRVETQLERSEVKFRTLISNIPCAVYRCVPDARWTMHHISDHIQKIAGHEAWDFIDNRVLSYSDIIYPEDKPRFEGVIRESLGKQEPYMIEYRIRHADGTLRWVYEKGQGYFEDGKALWIDGVIFDISERKAMEKKLEETLEQIKNLSLTDELTQLYNRRGFITHAEQQIRIAERNRRPVAIIFVDLNGMKGINDKLGHQVGDKALVETANILRTTFRKADITARLGGDEFAILAVETDDERAHVMMERLQANVAEFNRQSSGEFKLSMSTGLAHYDPDHPRSVEDLLQSADKKMYEMKREMKRNG